MSKYQNLDGKVAVVTGGATGIGRAISQLLSEQGAQVIIVYSKSALDAENTVHTITSQGGKAIARQVDIRNDSAVRSLMEVIARQFGGIDYLINNAGITAQLPFAELELIDNDVWDTLYATNVKGAFFCARAAASYMKGREACAIVNVGSIAGETGFGSSIPYAVSKAAMHGLTKSLARALAPDIRVNGVMPGAVKTRWWQGNEDKMYALSGQLPLQRISTPEDIADTVLMLLQALSITGQNIKAENGQTL